jgi:asparagine synthase (glutamine-hydrolysing)
MCGFCCIVTTDDPPPDAVVDHVAAALAHRGPDDQGVIRHVVDDALHPRHVALVHRRLAILDHEGGRQPMTTTDGRLTVVFNGCIYNHRALRAELEQQGKHFTSDHSDTEVLLLGYEQWGSDLPARLEGMFAFVILDRAANTLFAARDRTGEKPCFISRSGEHMVIASERAAVRAAADRASVSDADGSAAVVSYLRWGGVDFRTWLDGTAMLPPGRSITMALAPRLEDPAPTSYWSPPRRTISAQEEVDLDQFETLLSDSIERMLEADVPLGCFLSGGVDSSLVAALARSRVPDLATFCVRMPDPRYDESAYASRVAAHLGTEHTTLDAAIHPAADLVELIETVGEPFGDSSLLPTHWVSRAAREHVTVALAGDGGDELFAGYERHLAMGLLANWAPLLRLLPRGSFARAHPKSRRRKLGRLADAARGRGPADHYRSIVHLFDDVQLRALGLDPGDGCDGPYPEQDLAGLADDRRASTPRCTWTSRRTFRSICSGRSTSHRWPSASKCAAPSSTAPWSRRPSRPPRRTCCSGGNARDFSAPSPSDTYPPRCSIVRRWDSRSRSVLGSAMTSEGSGHSSATTSARRIPSRVFPSNRKARGASWMITSRVGPIMTSDSSPCSRSRSGLGTLRDTGSSSVRSWADPTPMSLRERGERPSGAR